MKIDFITRTLSDIASEKKGSIISGPFGSNISSKFFQESGVPVIRGNNLSKGSAKFIDDGFVFISEEKADELNAYAIKDDLIFTAAGTIGQVGLIEEDTKYEKYVISNKQLRVRLDLKKVNPLFAYYWFSSPWIVKEILNKNTGSTVPLINLGIIKTLEIKIPNKRILQDKIASVLYALDSKIELNNRINENLEAMAKTLYDYWFVQFDFPDQHGKSYKTSGGKMVWNDELKREIPAGWEVKEMNQLLKKNTTKFDFGSGNHNLDTIDLSVMPSGTLCLGEKNSSSSFGTNLFKLSKYDILFGAIRPYLLKAGIAPFDGLVTGTVHSFKVKKESEYNFSLLTMTHPSMFNFAISNSKGTKMPVIGAGDLLTYKVAYNTEVITKFNKCLLFREIVSHNIIENQQLAELRDWLLPMLMNGQVTVNSQSEKEIKTMKIACLGWGSLIWNPEKLLINDEWFEDGPMLRVEFTRQSNDQRITLIIDPDAEPVRVLWTSMTTTDLDEARKSLKIREGNTFTKNIHFVMASDESDDEIKQTIISWLKSKGLDAAIWTGLSFSDDAAGQRPTVEAVIEHLRNLAPEPKAKAEEYIRKAPKQIDTEYRRRIESELGWTHIEN